MEGSSTSSFSSCSSIGSTNDSANKITTTVIKFQCSYGGRILPRLSDGILRYVGGHTRVLSVDRFISYTELQAKLMELCGLGSTVSMRCQIPKDDLDALVSITTDEDLAILIEEYELAKLLPLKIRAFLHPQGSKSPKNPTLPTVPLGTSNRILVSAKGHQVYQHCNHQFSDPSRFQFWPRGDSLYVDHWSPNQPQYLINHGNYRR